MSYQITYSRGDVLTVCTTCSRTPPSRWVENGAVSHHCFFCGARIEANAYLHVRPYHLPEHLMEAYERASVIAQGEAELSNAPPLDYGMFDVASKIRVLNSPFTFGTSGKK